MRGHAADPTWRPHVIRNEATDGEMSWSRWSGWQAGDPRWRVLAIDTSGLPVEEVAARLVDWIAEERKFVRSGSHPLTNRAASDESSE